MNRRYFSLALASTACLATPALSKDKAHKQAFPSHGRVKLKVNARAKPMRKLFIVTPAGTVELPLNRTFPISNENRSSILKPTLAKKFRSGVEVGSVLTDGTDLVANLDRPLEIENLDIADEKISYRISAERAAPTRQPGLTKYKFVIGKVLIKSTEPAFANEILLKMKRDILIEDALSGL